eukprot:TRINITY_DN2665_c0_g1_i1.p2 TRINITY_DN2665_c0_g1~~TRINITY_DN2665_c0_g1_i1.p2  ORF type:complete len:176 (-),score=46.58 TRINITY_DN2665_c0_g1_i1:62-589(-)
MEGGVDEVKALLDSMLENNKVYVKEKTDEDPTYFSEMFKVHKPKILMITCVDSRVLPHEMTETGPNVILMFRNIANVINPGDISLMSVLNFAIEMLNVKHIIVLGHSCCQSVITATQLEYHGVIDNYLFTVKNVYQSHKKELDEIQDVERRFVALMEINVKEQVSTLVRLSLIHI